MEIFDLLGEVVVVAVLKDSHYNHLTKKIKDLHAALKYLKMFNMVYIPIDKTNFTISINVSN